MRLPSDEVVLHLAPADSGNVESVIFQHRLCLCRGGSKIEPSLPSKIVNLTDYKTTLPGSEKLPHSLEDPSLCSLDIDFYDVGGRN
jgi:hypothetical protein